MSLAVWLVPMCCYIAAGGWLWRRFAWRTAWADARSWSHPHRIDGGNVSMGIALGFVQACVWPLTLFLLHGFRTEAFYGFLAEPVASRRRREAKEREARIAELEHELHISR